MSARQATVSIDRLETKSMSIMHGKSRHSAPEVFSRGFATRVFGLKTCWPAADKAPCRMLEKTSRAQGANQAL